MVLKQFTTYRQLDAMDCGPTCLKMIFKHYGKQINREHIKKAAHLGTNGASLLGMSEAAERYGFQTISAKLTFEQLLSDAPLPCVLHWDQYHFVVLTPKANKKKVTVADPAKGLITYRKQEFLRNWISSNGNSEPKGIALLLTPTPMFYKQEEEGDKSVNWGTLAKYLWQYKSKIFQLFLGLMLGSLLQLTFPFLTQSIVDTGINTQNLTFIQLILIAQFTLFFARTAIEFIRNRILLFISTHLNLSILSDFWIKLMRLPLNFFDAKQIGDLFQRISDHKRIKAFITGTALQSISSVFNLLVFSVVLLMYNLTIFLIFSTGSLLYFLWIRVFLKYRASLDHKLFAASSRENSATMEMILGMPEIKLNNAEYFRRWEWEGLQTALFKLDFKSLSLNQYQQAGAFFLNEGKNIFITFLAAKFVLDGDLTLGAMLAIQYMIGQLNVPVEQLMSFTQQAQDAKISLERLNEIHKLEDEEPANRQFLTSLPKSRHIILENLSFTYPGAGNTPVLKNINLHIPEGKVTAIVGMSGSGKTTLLKLLLKMFEGHSGDIRVGGSNLKHLSSRFWRSQCGSVMQDGYIFSDSIAKNISISDENPVYEKLLHACEVANILNLVESMPLGFNTRIGANGNGISTGQKQRILIARVVYKDPEFIFFDEATNALDANNEKVIMENLNTFFKGKSVVVVAHRLSTVKNADKIMVLDQGKIIEEGNHAQLTNRKGRYYELVKNQLELGN